jgi:hypothetical protein
MSGRLDCFSVDTAAYSLAELLQLSQAAFESKVASIDVDWDHEETSPEDQVLIQLDVDPRSPPEPSGVRWFHATRAVPGTNFEDGLQPTLAALPKMWDALGACAAEWLTKQEWIEYQNSFMRGNRQFSGQFRRKRMASGWEGPFAFLVRDAALGKHDTHKDFTRLCETMEDICADFEMVHGRSLRQAYERLSCQCLVVFTWPGAWPGAVRAAANYVFRTLRGIEIGRHCNTNFSGMGKPVPGSLIELVEWL